MTHIVVDTDVTVWPAKLHEKWWGRRFRLPTLDPSQSGWQAEAPAPPWLVWFAISLAGVAAGLRFFPRYYFQLLPVVVLLAARGFAEIRGRRLLLALLLLIPLARFAPTYFMAARDAGWRDTAMDRDSRAASPMVNALLKPGDTLFVWGFRPEIYVYSHLPAATRFLDSQPLTGVPADRH